MTLSAQAEVALFVRSLKWLAGVIGCLWGVWRLVPILPPMTSALHRSCSILLAVTVNALLHDLHAQDRQGGVYVGERLTFLELPLHSPAQP